MSGKKAKQLPLRGALTDLDKSQRTINDYGKLSPIKPMQPTPSILQGLIKPKGL
jgi:hypothetical protein